MGIPEYWIVDPRERAISVLVLRGDHYIEHGGVGAGQRATSALFPEFAVATDDVFALV